MQKAWASIAYMSPPMDSLCPREGILRSRQRRLELHAVISPVRWRYRREEQSSRDRQLHGHEATIPRQYRRRGNENHAAGDCRERTSTTTALATSSGLLQIMSRRSTELSFNRSCFCGRDEDISAEEALRKAVSGFTNRPTICRLNFVSGGNRCATGSRLCLRGLRQSLRCAHPEAVLGSLFCDIHPNQGLFLPDTRQTPHPRNCPRSKVLRCAAILT